MLAWSGLVPVARGWYRPDTVLSQVPPESLVERLTLRRVDPMTGVAYHLLYAPPAARDVQARLRQHPRDNEESVTHRIAQYSAFEAELHDCYPEVCGTGL